MLMILESLALILTN